MRFNFDFNAGPSESSGPRTMTVEESDAIMSKAAEDCAQILLDASTSVGMENPPSHGVLDGLITVAEGLAKVRIVHALRKKMEGGDNPLKN